MMKKLITAVLIILAASLAFAGEYAYVNDGGTALSTPTDIYFDGRLIEADATVTFDSYVYNDYLTLHAATPSALILAHTSVSTTSAATTTVSVDELADVTISIDVGTSNVSDLTVYFNDTGNTAITVDADWEYDANTMFVNSLYVLNTATTTDYALTIERRF